MKDDLSDTMRLIPYVAFRISGAIVSMAFDFKYEQYLSIYRIVYVQVRSSTILDIINQVYIKKINHISIIYQLFVFSIFVAYLGMIWGFALEQVLQLNTVTLSQEHWAHRCRPIAQKDCCGTENASCMRNA